MDFFIFDSFYWTRRNVLIARSFHAMKPRNNNWSNTIAYTRLNWCNLFVPCDSRNNKAKRHSKMTHGKSAPQCNICYVTHVSFLWKNKTEKKFKEISFHWRINMNVVKINSISKDKHVKCSALKMSRSFVIWLREKLKKLLLSIRFTMQKKTITGIISKSVKNNFKLQRLGRITKSFERNKDLQK